MKEFYDYKEIEQEVQDRWDQQKPYKANIDTKKGDEKNRAFAVAKGIKVNEIKKAEKAIKCKTTLSIVKKG